MTEVVTTLTPVPPAQRRQLLDRRGDAEAHRRAVTELPVLVEVRKSEGTSARLGDPIRVVAWNLERARHTDAILSTLEDAAPDVALLTELDVGMVRSGNVDTVQRISAGLGHSSAFGVEFVELGFGNAAETEAAGPDAVNADGLHGNAVLAAGELREPTVVRIETDGSWFSPDSREPRVGGRMAVAARVETSGGPLVLAAVHLESDSDAALRAAQMRVVLEALDDAYGSDLPGVVGGDLNTFSTSQAQLFSAEEHARLTEEDPDRWWWPVPHEPLFGVAAAHGFAVDAANEARPTVRLAAEQRSAGLPRLDWLLVRGVTVHDRWAIPAVTADGAVITDHDAVMATISLTP